MKCLASFECATKMLEYNDASILCFIPIVTTIMNDLINITNQDEGIKTMKRKLLDSMQLRFQNLENDNDLILATYLNPQYRSHLFQNSETKDKVKTLLVSKIQSMLSNESQKRDESDPALNISEHSDCDNSLEKSMANIIRSKSENNTLISDNFDMQFNIQETLRKYEMGPTLSLKKSPLGYWKDRCELTEKSWVKAMSQVAKIYLTPPPTSCDVERLFSTASEILNQRRNRLLPSNAEKLLFVHENIAHVKYQWW